MPSVDEVERVSYIYFYIVYNFYFYTSLKRIKLLFLNLRIFYFFDLKRDGRRFFQQSVGVPLARIAPVVPSVAMQQNSRQFVKVGFYISKSLVIYHKYVISLSSHMFSDIYCF